jgi:TPR repeat protein
LTLDRDKLAKILGLLGSDKLGEVMSAAKAADALIRDADTSWAEVLNQTAVADDARTVHNGNALLAENAKLRATVRRLWAENRALREQASRRLAHRILDGVKQSGQALLARVIAFDGIAFLRRELTARHGDSESRAQSVVFYGLVAAGITLAMGIVAFLSLEDVARLGGPSVRSETTASSGQEALRAAAGSGGLPAEAERRRTISGQLSSPAMVTPETMPQPPRPEAVVAPVEDSAIQPAIPAVAAPGQTDQASAAEMAALVKRGDAFLSAGDIVSARLFYERAADGGDGDAALRLGATFDPDFLSRAGVRGAPSEQTQAWSWYRRALDLGNSAAQEALRGLEQPRFAAPDSPSH